MRSIWLGFLSAALAVPAAAAEKRLMRVDDLLRLKSVGAPALDRNVSQPIWAPDGKSLRFWVEDDAAQWIGRVPVNGGAIQPVLKGRRVVAFMAQQGGKTAVLATGDKDFNVPLLNSEQMYQALRSQGVDTQLIIYPGQFHGLKRPSFITDRMQRYLDWYAARLK